MKRSLLSLLLFTTILSCTPKTKYETIIRNGLIYDGNGEKPYNADIGINADTIAFIGDLKNAEAKNEMNAKGQAVSPGFINMLSWATIC